MVDANAPRSSSETLGLDTDKVARLWEQAAEGYKQILAERATNTEAQVGGSPVARNSLQDIKVGRAAVHTRAIDQVVGPFSRHIGAWPIVYDYFPDKAGSDDEDQGCAPALEFERGIEVLELDTYLSADSDLRVGLVKDPKRSSYLLKLLSGQDGGQVVDLGALNEEQLPAVLVRGRTLAQTFGDEIVSVLNPQAPPELSGRLFEAQILGLRGHASQPRAELI